MKYFTIGRWLCCCDPEATRQAYTSFEERPAETCGCCYCRNFAAARSQVYPAEVRGLFEEIGIDFTKEAEVYELIRLAPGLRLYGGWFHFVGRIEEETGDGDKRAILNETFSISVHDNPVLIPDPFQGVPLLQLDFNAHVPWVLQEPEPD